MENKVSTWDVLQKRNFEGPSWCCLCKQDMETSSHLFLRCPFAQEVWKEVLSLVQVRENWRGLSMDEALSTWW